MAPDVPASARVLKSSSSSLRWTLAADASSAEVTIGRKIMFLGEKDNSRGEAWTARHASPRLRNPRPPRDPNTVARLNVPAKQR